MTVVEPPNDPPLAEPHLPLRDPFSEFLPERRIPAEPNQLIDRASLIGVATAPNVSPVTHPVSRNSWFIGAVMLGVGLAAGFASGAAAVMQYGGDKNASISNRANSEQPRVEVPPPVDPPGRDPIAQTANDPPRTTETHATTTTQPESLNTGQRASVEPVNMIPESPVAVLYVQSRPAGAQVYLDDQLISTTPFQMPGITPGRHSIRIDLRGYHTWSALVTVEPAARIRIAAALER